MTNDWNTFLTEMNAKMPALRGAAPEVMKAFAAMAQAAGRDGALDAKTKELIALGISVAVQCDACILYHTKKLASLGATREEIGETLGMGIYMGAGPKAMYAAQALQAFDTFAAPKAAAAE